MPPTDSHNSCNSHTLAHWEQPCDVRMRLSMIRQATFIFIFGLTLYYVKIYEPRGKTMSKIGDGYPVIKRHFIPRNLTSDDGIHRVLFFSYIRGGSSIGSEIFDLDNRSILWYEPLDPFYFSNTGYYGRKCQKVYMNEDESMLRSISDWELSRLTRFLIDLYDCRMEALPSELRVHRFLLHTSALKSYTSCYERQSSDSLVWDLVYCRRILHDVCGMSVETALTKGCHDLLDAIHQASNIKNGRPSPTDDFRLSEADQQAIIRHHLVRAGYDARKLGLVLPDALRYRSCLDDLEEISAGCLPFAVEACQNRRIRVAKLVRATMLSVETLLSQVTGLRVIFFVRDPRAVAVSRSSQSKPKEKVFRNFVKLCLKLRADLRQKEQLQRTFPDSVLTVKYEDFVVSPLFWIEAMYDHIGIQTPEAAAYDLVKTRLYTGRNDGRKFGNIRANASQIASTWRSVVTADLMFRMQQTCPDVLTALEYPFY